MLRTKSLWFCGCALFGTVLFLTATSFADGIMLNGVSARSLSRGGTNLGHFDNGGILHDNPAAMTNISGDGLVDIGAIGIFGEFAYADPDNPGGVNSSTFTPIPQVSYIRKSCDGCWAYGIGVFTPAGFSTGYNMNGPFPVGGPQHYKSFGALLKVLPGLSYKVTDEFSIGGTAGLGISHAELEGPYTLQGPGFLAGTPTRMDINGTGVAPVWSLAAQYIWSDCTTIGLTYNSESSMALDGNTVVAVPGLGTSQYDSVINMTWPESLALGVRHDLGCGQTFSCDVIYFGWQQAFREFNMELRDPSNGFFPPIDETLPLNWRDTVSVRLGYERELALGGTARVGYVHHTSPIPLGTITPYIPANLEHAVSMGYGFGFDDWEFDAGYMYLWGPQANVGTSALLGGDFSNSTLDSQIHAVLLSVMKKF